MQFPWNNTVSYREKLKWQTRFEIGLTGFGLMGPTWNPPSNFGLVRLKTSPALFLLFFLQFQRSSDTELHSLRVMTRPFEPGSSSSRFQVFDFNDDDERVDKTSNRFDSQFGNPKKKTTMTKTKKTNHSPITKYQFLQFCKFSLFFFFIWLESASNGAMERRLTKKFWVLVGKRRREFLDFWGICCVKLREMKILKNLYIYIFAVC